MCVEKTNYIPKSETVYVMVYQFSQAVCSGSNACTNNGAVKSQSSNAHKPTERSILEHSND